MKHALKTLQSQPAEWNSDTVRVFISLFSLYYILL